MNNTAPISVDTKEWENLIKSLRSPLFRKAIGKATKQGSDMIKSRALSNFQTLQNKTTKGRSGRLSGLTISGNVRVKKGSLSSSYKVLPLMVDKTYSNKTSNPFTSLTLRTRGNKTDFRAWLFEGGTKARFAKGRYHRGNITAGRYLGRAVEEVAPRVLSLMQKMILTEIDKAGSKI